MREKLKKTSIATLPKYGVTAASADHPADDDHFMATQTTVAQESRDVESNDPNTRGRPARKRSFDDLEATDQITEENKPIPKSPMEERHEGHARKRSRDIHADNPPRENGRRKTSREEALLEEEAKEGPEDNSMSGSDDGHARSDKQAATPPDQIEAMDEDAGHGVLSPRKKRSRDQVEQDQDKKQKVAATEEERARRNSEEEEKVAVQHSREPSQNTSEEPERKRSRDSSEEGKGKEQNDLSTTKVSKHTCRIFAISSAALANV